MLIDLTKKYRTRSGHEVKLTPHFGTGSYPVRGRVVLPGGLESHQRTWTEEGHFFRTDAPGRRIPHDFDLFEAPAEPSDEFAKMCGKLAELRSELLEAVHTVRADADRRRASSENTICTRLQRLENKLGDVERRGSLQQASVTLDGAAPKQWTIGKPEGQPHSGWANWHIDAVPEPDTPVLCEYSYELGPRGSAAQRQGFDVFSHDGADWRSQRGRTMRDNVYLRNFKVRRWRYVEGIS